MNKRRLSKRDALLVAIGRRADRIEAEFEASPTTERRDRLLTELRAMVFILTVLENDPKLLAAQA
jgi:hypothetical protein